MLRAINVRLTCLCVRVWWWVRVHVWEVHTVLLRYVSDAVNSMPSTLYWLLQVLLIISASRTNGAYLKSNLIHRLWSIRSCSLFKKEIILVYASTNLFYKTNCQHLHSLRAKTLTIPCKTDSKQNDGTCALNTWRAVTTWGLVQKYTSPPPHGWSRIRWKFPHTWDRLFCVYKCVCLRAPSCHCLSTGLARLVHTTGLAEHPHHRLSAWFNQLNWRNIEHPMA